MGSIMPVKHRASAECGRQAQCRSNFNHTSRIESSVLAISMEVGIASLVREYSRFADKIIVGTVIVAMNPDIGLEFFDEAA